MARALVAHARPAQAWLLKKYLGQHVVRVRTLVLDQGCVRCTRASACAFIIHMRVWERGSWRTRKSAYVR